MKKHFFILLMMLGVASLGFAQLTILDMEPEPRPFAAAVLKMAEMDYDFGTIDRGLPVSHTFEFVNEGDAPLLISNVKTSCGCTATSYSKEAIGPGESGFVEATYNAAKDGVFNKSLTVVSNGGDITLYIRGKVN